MPVSKKKRTTSDGVLSKSEPSSLARALLARTLAYPVRRTLVHFSIRHGDKADSTSILTA